MLRIGSTFVMAAGLAMFAGGCSEKEEPTPVEKYGKEIQSVRVMIFRDGTVTRALSNYRMTTGTLPTTEQGLKALTKRPKGMDANAWLGPYIDSAADYTDMWGNELHYRYPSETHPDKPQLYDLWSLGPDGKDGTDDDLLNHQYR